MPSGFTTTTTASMDVVSLHVYVVEGVVLMALNGACALLIYLSRNLRSQKEYILFAGSMVYDFLFGLMYFLAGIRRLQIYYGPDELIEAYSRWECFRVAHTFLFVLNTPTSGIMSFLCCLDRFISVTFPTKYLRFTPTYGYALTLITLLSVIPTTVVSGILTYQDSSVYDVTSVCVLQEGIPVFMFDVLRGIRIVSTLLGVLLYVYIGYRIYYMIKPTRSDPQSLSNEKHRRLMTMTRTFLLITLNQLLLFVAPDIYLLVERKDPIFLSYVLNMNKGVVNILILFLTQKDLRHTLVEKFKTSARSNVKFFTETSRVKIAPIT